VRDQRWSDLPPLRRRGIVLAGTVQVTLAAFAWVDLARRPGERVRGSKAVWAAVIAVNFVGPITYLCFGRITGSVEEKP
jgi:hypothetical protein